MRGWHASRPAIPFASSFLLFDPWQLRMGSGPVPFIAGYADGSGVLRGVGKGLVGAIGLPVSGALGLVSSVSAGVASATGALSKSCPLLPYQLCLLRELTSALTRPLGHGRRVATAPSRLSLTLMLRAGSGELLLSADQVLTPLGRCRHGYTPCARSAGSRSDQQLRLDRPRCGCCSSLNSADAAF